MSDASIPVLNRVEQQRNFGIDCGDAIHFEAGSWLPGGEHGKKITVKNISKRTIKFKYELPTTKYFSMDFPTLITLSPGMHTLLDVAFRPLKVEEYDDFVTFHVQIIEGGVTASSGRFRLPVVARIASLAMNVPTGLDFGFCPTAETTELKFWLRNTGQIRLVFDWSLPGAGEHGRPFAIHPSSGHVGVGERVELTASFSPTIASVYVTTTICMARPATNDDFSSTTVCCEESMKLSGISKFTHIAASESELNFGEILVGAASSSRAPTEKEFILRNRSLVHATFRVVRVESDCDPVFAFSPMAGVVPPESSTTIKVRYTPTSAGNFTCDHFYIVTPGGNRERVTCKGRAVGPVVSLWKKNLESNFVRTRSLNFGDVAVGKSISRVVTIRNESPAVDVFFHFDCQEKGIFEFDKITGKVPPLTDLNVTLTFTPPRASNFYRRFFLLVQNQSVLFIDVLGTGYDDKVRPSPFQQAHVDAYRLRAASGMGLLSPDQLETYWQENGDNLFLTGALRSRKDGEETEMPLARTQLLTRSGEASLADVDVCQEFFVSIEEKGNPIAVQGAFLDFGNCSIVQFPSKKILHVTNNTHGKVSCAWRVASTAAGAAATTDTSPSFQVFPETLDISAGATAEFRVAFQPSTENAYYFAELEGYVSFKSNRTFRLVNVETFTPPWCVISKVCGNTFASPTEQFLPKISFRLCKNNKVEFPSCYAGDSVFQTILMENASDTPALFAFTEDPSATFECKPSSGYIAPKRFHLVQIRFAPRKAKGYTYLLHCIVNNARAMPMTLELAGICALPHLTLQEDDHQAVTTLDLMAAVSQSHEARVYIKPTAVGLVSSRTLVITNDSRVPLVFHWDIPHKLHDVFDVTPKLGRLNGRESTSITCRFTPQELRAYASRFTVAVKPISIAWSQHTPASSQQQQRKIPVLQEATLRVHTKGTAGAIAFEPEATQFETILVNTSVKKTVFIVNSADCDLEFTLLQTLRILRDGESDAATSSSHSSHSHAAPARLEFSETKGCIPAHSRKQITVTFLPRVAGVFAFDVACHTSVNGDADGPGNASPTRQRWHPPHVHHCHIRAEASFPTIVIDDIRVPHLPSALAWQQFLCQEINDYMAAPPPLPVKVDGVESARPESPPDHDQEDATIKHVAVAFSPAPLGSAPQQVFFKLRNPGGLVVEFALRYPKEGNVEIEHWAETGAPSSDEIRTNAIIDSKVFQISPRRATLLPQQSITLAVSYSFASDSYGGIHDLPVLLQVDKGTSLVLELQGRTLPHSEPKLFLSRRVFTLSPVMIGEYRRSFPTDENDDENRDYAAGAAATGSALTRPPLQQIEVFNRGDTAFRLDVSSNAFDKINHHDFVQTKDSAAGTNGTSRGTTRQPRGSSSSSFVFPVLRCVTSSEIVPAHSSVFVDIEFAPIEAKPIEANLLLKAYGLMGRAYKEVAMVTLLATGYHPQQTTLAALRRELALAAGGAPPPSQRIAVPGQSVRLVSDLVAFNHVPTCAQRTELVVLTNAAGVVQFEWDASHPLVSSGVVAFSPARGELQPGQESLVRVTITTSGQVFVVDHDIACRITPANAQESALSPQHKPVSGGSPTRRTSDAAAANGAVSKRRSSVITRSTTAQQAITGMSNATAALTSPTTRKSGPTEAPMAAASSTYPIFVHIYAHVVARDVLEWTTPHEALVAMPLPTVPPKMDELSSASLVLPPKSPEEIAACQQVVVDVMEMLFSDVLASDAVQHAVDSQFEQQLPSNTHSPLEPLLYRRARQSEDCAAITTTVMENTVFNILQELFNGDIDQELACVPRKNVFPMASSPRKASSVPTAAAH